MENPQGSPILGLAARATLDPSRPFAEVMSESSLSDVVIILVPLDRGMHPGFKLGNVDTGPQPSSNRLHLNDASAGLLFFAHPRLVDDSNSCARWLWRQPRKHDPTTRTTWKLLRFTARHLCRRFGIEPYYFG